MSQTVTIYGTLTDFEGAPIPNGIVGIKDSSFADVYTVSTDECGRYSMTVDKGVYLALYAVEGYIERHLEYWCWNMTAKQDMEINMQIGGLELYAVNAFTIPRPKPLAPVMIYFRPMSLKRTLPILEKLAEMVLVDVAPRLTADDLTVTLNGKHADILSVCKVPEIPTDNQKQTMYGYLVEVTDPTAEDDAAFVKIDVVAKDSETDERGMGSFLWER